MKENEAAAGKTITISLELFAEIMGINAFGSALALEHSSHADDCVDKQVMGAGVEATAALVSIMLKTALGLTPDEVVYVVEKMFETEEEYWDRFDKTADRVLGKLGGGDDQPPRTH